MTNRAQLERGLLCDELLERGPDAATLCGSWTTRDLAAHLVLRERRPDAAAGIVLHQAALARYTEKVRLRIAASPWPDLVDAVRTGPPCWSPTRIGAIDELTNTVEFFVHHEDVRRAQPGWTARALEAGFEAALAKALGRMKLLLRGAPVGVRLCTPDGTALVARSGADTVTVTGRPSELVLFAFGRQAVAEVELRGAASAVQSLKDATLGI